MKMIIQVLASLVLVAVQAQAAQREVLAPIEVASLSACESRSLNIELNVDGRTPKYQLIEAMKLLADYPYFTFTPIHSNQSSTAFRAELQANCDSDACAKAVGWFDLQYRIERFKGVAVSCAKDEPTPPVKRMPAPRAPGMPGGAPGGGQPTDPNQPPIPGGGVVGGN